MNDKQCAQCHNLKGLALQNKNIEICGDCQRDNEIDADKFLNEVNE